MYLSLRNRVEVPISFFIFFIENTYIALFFEYLEIKSSYHGNIFEIRKLTSVKTKIFN